MAWARCALSPFLTSSSSSCNIVSTRKTLVSVSSLSPSKLTKRKNYLRQKLLKTLKKPQSTPLLPQENPRNLSETLEFSQEGELDISSDRNCGEFSGDFAGEQEGNDELTQLGSHELRVLETTSAGLADTPDVFSTGFVFETVLYIVGLFVFQTVCAVWVFGSVDFDKKSGNGEGEAKLGVSGTKLINGKKKDNFLSGRSSEIFGKFFGSKRGGVVYVANSQFEDKIVEVRAMAREAREIEAKKLRTNDQVSSSDVIGVDGNETVPKTVVSRVKTNIHKEVDGRLSKLEKRLNSLRDKSSLLAVSYLNNSGKVEDKKASPHLDSKLKTEKFVFKKKLKFRSSPDKPETNPKGFPTVKDQNMLNGNSRIVTQDASFRSGSNVSDLSVQEMRVDLLNGDSEESMTTREELSTNELSSFQESGWNLEKEGEYRSGGVQETSRELVEPRVSSELKKKISQSFTKEVEYKPMVEKFRDKRMDTENDLWWMNLPYALAIILRRGSDSEGPRGLYSLKMDKGSSYTVVFEDHRDANYFCYILESFFEDLGDFSADVVPLSIEELKDTFKSGTKKIMVVRKGQIRLYAGQPLADVEMALRSFVG